MIDLDASKIAAEVTRQFASGQISNFEFEMKMPDSNDSAIWATEDTLRCFYDDFKEHKINAHWKVPHEVKNMMARWVMFLYSNEEYLWLKISCPGIRPIEYGLVGKLFNEHKMQKSFMRVGNYSVWPFISIESYESVKNKPVLLAGS
ncbi:MAG: hypothetical protein V3U75_06580 [Methylococcaceae bacterium]